MNIMTKLLAAKAAVEGVWKGSYHVAKAWENTRAYYHRWRERRRVRKNFRSSGTVED